MLLWLILRPDSELYMYVYSALIDDIYILHEH